MIHLLPNLLAVLPLLLLHDQTFHNFRVPKGSTDGLALHTNLWLRFLAMQQNLGNVRLGVDTSPCRSGQSQQGQTYLEAISMHIKKDS